MVLTRRRFNELKKAEAERDLYGHALREIATRATYERNPDGLDQAAATMQLIAREALDASEATKSPPTPSNPPA